MRDEDLNYLNLSVVRCALGRNGRMAHEWKPLRDRGNIVAETCAICGAWRKGEYHTGKDGKRKKRFLTGKAGPHSDKRIP
jgi:hypothetical protein